MTTGAHAVVPVHALRHGYAVEVQAIAAVPGPAS